MTLSPPASLITESLRIDDPRKFGSAGRLPKLTRHAQALTMYAPAKALGEMTLLLHEHLANHAEQELREALAACPDHDTYAVLFGFLAREACQWTVLDENLDADIYCLFGIPLTLHSPEGEGLDWEPRDWGHGNNEPDLVALRRILDETGITAGMHDLTILPHLVDPEELVKMGFSDMHNLAPELVLQCHKVRASGKLPHRPWKGVGGGAQSRVLVMAARSKAAPRGLDAHNNRCTVALTEWAGQSSAVPETLRMVASSPERLASLIKGKGLHMFNYAKLAHLVGTPMPQGARVVSPFIAMEAIATGPGQGELRFRKGDATCIWEVHGRTDWEEVTETVGHLLMGTTGRFVRVQLGLG